MKYVILAHGLRAAGGKSVGLNIISALRTVRPDHEYLVVVPEDADYRGLHYPEHCTVVRYGHGSVFTRLVFDLFKLPRVVRDFGADVVFGLGNMGIRNPHAKQAVLIHKPQLVYPASQRSNEVLRRRMINLLIRWQVAFALQSTQVMFFQTPVMMARFKRTFGYNGRSEMMPNAVSFEVAESPVIHQPETLQHIKTPIKLFVLTRYYAHKNLELIVECFDRFRGELQNFCCILTINRDQHPLAGKLLDDIRDKDLEDQVVNVGPISQQELGDYYTASEALLLPTLLESFTGTYLEAMKFDCPVITSDLDFARDICSDAAVYFDPRDAAALKDALLRFRAEPWLKEAMDEKGRAVITQYHRDRTQIADTDFRLLDRC